MKKLFDSLKIIRSERKSISIEIKWDLSIVVRAPQRMSDRDIANFVESKREWIENSLEIAKKRLEDENSAQAQKLTSEEVKALFSAAKQDFPTRAEKWAKIMNVDFSRVTIRMQRTLWGSCSGKKNLNFNCLLMLCDEKIRDYVVIHELCHLTQMNHSQKFWSLVESYCPDYRTQRKYLRDNGRDIMKKVF